MTSFSQRYKKLNPAQRQAVDTIEGPVMVIAGPGTGKTELLSMRVANILQKTDTNAQNILCLTFTDSGAAAMRQRLVGLMGKEAYKVAIHTFHSFGTEIINTHPHYFYQGAEFRPADDLNTYEVLRGIFEKLPLDNPIAGKMNNEFTHLRDARNTISELKRSGLTADELLSLLDHNDAFVAYAEPMLKEVFARTIYKKDLPSLEPFGEHLAKFQPEPMKIPGYVPLGKLCSDEFSQALATAQESGKTTAITKWRNTWCEKNEAGEFMFKDTRRAKKLRAIAHLYYQYLLDMQSKALYDFDDMILRVVHALEVFPELRFTLQEQYQYILVDEFQDTNGAQLRILLNLTNSNNEGRPNILIVGDDDQAIYSFQGAEMSNILTFRDRFRDPAIITLTDNYRSSHPILTAARNVITQGEERLETHLDNLDKTLTPHYAPTNTTVKLAELSSVENEHTWLVREVQARLEAGQNPNDIAILTRKHSEIAQLLPYFHHAGIAVNYERRDNVLEMPPIVALEQLGRALTDITEQRFDALNARLPKLLAHPAWNVPPLTLWQLGLMAHRNQKYWLEMMLESEDQLRDIAQWLVVTAHLAATQPLEQMLDIMLGTHEKQMPSDDDTEPVPEGAALIEGFASPLRDYFFPHDALEKHPGQYVAYLRALSLIRQKLRDYSPGGTLLISDFIAFIDLHRSTNTTITSPRSVGETQRGINIMTVHKSKGLEFETVFVANATDTTWGSKARTRSRLISYPHNLPIGPVGESEDERLRLFFVAMTRAKRELLLSYALESSAQKATLRANFLQNDSLPTHQPTIESTEQQKVQQAENTWHENVLSVADADLQATLAPLLERYKLSATHLNNFLDVTNGGPRAFLLQNLLRFPQAMSPSAALGSAIHKALQRAHTHLSATGKRRPVEDVLHDFEVALTEHRLDTMTHDSHLQKGSDMLQTFLAQRYDSFDEAHIVERNFSNQGVIIDNAALTGALDLMHIDKATCTITVTDYKTGKPATRWQGSDDYQKIKLHKYKQQLMFYKLLVEHSRDFGGAYTVNRGVLAFVEPTRDGDIIQLEMEYDTNELERFRKLIVAIWQRIQNLDFPDTSEYAQNYKGILAFEESLLDD